MSDPKIRFEEATEKLYAAFAGYPLPEDTGMCTHCHKPEDELKLRSKPLRELSEEDLEDYGFSALTTWGNEDVFKYFLPRMFEITCQIPTSYLPNQEIIFRKLNYAEWRDWPIDEKTAVEDFFMAAWEYLLACDESFGWDDLLCSIGQAVDDLTPYLKAWEESGLTGLWHLSEYIADEYLDVAQKHKLSDSFWQDKSYEGDPWCNDRTAQMNQVIEWLEKPSTCELLENAYLENPNHPLAASIAEGADYLRWIETYRKNTTCE